MSRQPLPLWSLVCTALAEEQARESNEALWQLEQAAECDEKAARHRAHAKECEERAAIFADGLTRLSK